MAEPRAAFVATLITKGDAHIGQVVIVGENHTAFAGGDLLIGIKGEDGHFAEGAGLFAFQLGAEGFTAILEDGEVVSFGDFADFVEVGGAAEGLDRHNGFGILGYFIFDFCGVDVEGFRVDIDKDGFCACHHNGIRGGDEGEGRDNDFVAGADSEGQER